MSSPAPSQRDGGHCDREDILGTAIQVWADNSRELGFEGEADSVRQMSIVAHQSSVVLVSHSIRSNQMCRNVICDGLPSSMMQDLTPLLISGCCYNLYNRLLYMQQGLKTADGDDKLKISRIISFLDSDREFMKVIKAHQNIEDIYHTFSILIPRLKQIHITETLGKRLSQSLPVSSSSLQQQPNQDPTLLDTENKSKSGRDKKKHCGITSMLYHNYPCGECKFQYTMDSA
jgi:hypothetical protein